MFHTIDHSIRSNTYRIDYEYRRHSSCGRFSTRPECEMRGHAEVEVREKEGCSQRHCYDLYFIRKLIDLNNSAVASLQEGRHKKALDLLRAAIAGLMDHFVSDVPSSATLVSRNEKDAEDHSSHMEVEDQKQDKPSIFSVPLWTEESFPQRQDETSIFMYAQVLLLAHADHIKELLAGVVFYNMALVNHARAIERNASSLLTVALKIYGMAVGVMQCRNGGADASNSWLLLAVYNNMAQIYLYQVCSEKLCLCLGNIRVLLDSDGAEHIIDADDYCFFLTNTMLQLRVVAAPAA
jgi:hypothetical protein